MYLARRVAARTHDVDLQTVWHAHYSCIVLASDPATCGANTFVEISRGWLDIRFHRGPVGVYTIPTHILTIIVTVN